MHLAGQAAVADATATVDQRRSELTDTRAALADATSLGQVRVDAAQAHLDAVEADPGSSPAEEDAARADLAQAQADAAAAVRSAQTQVLSAESALAAAEQARADAPLRAAAADEAAASRTSAAQAALDGLVAGGPTASPLELASADADLAAARAAAASTARSGARLVADAEAAAAAAAGDVAPAEAFGQAMDEAERNAQEALAIRGRLGALAAQDLGTAQRQAGVQVPADELVVVPAAPVRVSEVTATIGSPATGPVMKVTNTAVAVDSSLALDEAQLITPGMVVQLDEPDLGIAATGVVSYVAAGPGTNGVDGFHVYIEVVVDGNPSSLPGTSVRITVPVESSDGEALVVPVGAVSLASDGSSRVRVDHGGTLEDVTVEPGLVAEGYVVVRPSGGTLEAGDQVAVGKGVGTGA